MHPKSFSVLSKDPACTNTWIFIFLSTLKFCLTSKNIWRMMHSYWKVPKDRMNVGQWWWWRCCRSGKSVFFSIYDYESNYYYSIQVDIITVSIRMWNKRRIELLWSFEKEHNECCLMGGDPNICLIVQKCINIEWSVIRYGRDPMEFRIRKWMKFRCLSVWGGEEEYLWMRENPNAYNSNKPSLLLPSHAHSQAES